MKKEELENLIRKTLKTTDSPSRASLIYTLRKIEDSVTEPKLDRYYKQTATSKIISKISYVFNTLKTKQMILIPSLILLVFIGGFSLSTKHNKQDFSMSELIKQDASIEEFGVDYDDGAVLAGFEEPYINDLSTIENEI